MRKNPHEAYKKDFRFIDRVDLADFVSISLPMAHILHAYVL